MLNGYGPVLVTCPKFSCKNTCYWMSQLLQWHSGRQRDLPRVTQAWSPDSLCLPAAGQRKLCRKHSISALCVGTSWGLGSLQSGWKSPGNSHHKPTLSQEQMRMNLSKGAVVLELTDPHFLSGPEHISQLIPKCSWKRAPGSYRMVIRQTLHFPHPQKWWHLHWCLVSVVLATAISKQSFSPASLKDRQRAGDGGWPRYFLTRSGSCLRFIWGEGEDLKHPARIVYICLFYTHLTPTGIQGSRHSSWQSSTHGVGIQAMSVDWMEWSDMIITGL